MQGRLGYMYHVGQGVTQDYAEASRWYRKAASQGHAVSQFNLGAMYSKGQEVPQDYVEAYMWISMAASRVSSNLQKGYADALEELAKKMTPQQIAEAQSRAQDLGKLVPPASPPGSSGYVRSGRGPGFGPGEGGGFGGGVYRPGDGVYRPGNGVTSPTITFKVEPAYSEEARQAKFQGTVILSIEVNEKGLVQNPRVLRALGMGLDQKAIEAVMKWRFRPGMKDGKPVVVSAQVEANFRLPEAKRGLSSGKEAEEPSGVDKLNPQPVPQAQRGAQDLDKLVPPPGLPGSGSGTAVVRSTGQNVSDGRDYGFEIIADTTGEVGAPAPAFLVTSPARDWAKIPGAAWIGPAADQSNAKRGACCANTSDTYRMTFSLGDAELSNVVFNIAVAADDSVDVRLNGKSVYTGGGWSTPKPLAVRSGFIAGRNTLDFVVHNGNGPTGLIAAVTRSEGKGVRDLSKLVPPPNIPLNLPNVNMAQYGGPPARISPPSSGPGSGGGIGSGQGPGIRSDSADALIVLAEKGDPGAQYSLGLRFEKGDRVLQDYAGAAQWYRKAAEQGHTGAQVSLGLMYSEGKGVPADLAEALRWYRKAAEQGEIGAQSHMGLMYDEDKGVRQDFVEAARWYRKAAEQGDALAQLGLARLYSEGKGVPKDESEALRWFVKADAQGVPIDPSEQIRWYQKIYEHADTDTAARLAQRFHYGSGVPQNLSEAARWYRKAAEQGHIGAQHTLGGLYAEGRGVPRDDAEAVRWYRKAAEQGDASAQASLSFMYQEGRGVPQDSVEAHAWANLAASQGVYTNLREEIAKKMTPGQIAEAQNRARDLGKLLPRTVTPGSGGGVDSARDPGFGPGEGGGFGGGAYRVGNGVTAPTLTFKVEPEYSEEARTAKFMGTVILYIDVNDKGAVQNPRVLRSVGMGLDEKAVEAVMKWRFRPGYKDGKPVTVGAQVEVNFRLL